MEFNENSSLIICSNRTLAGMLAKQYLNSKTADIFFRIDSDTEHHEIPAHRCFLAATNSEFHRLFYEKSQNGDEPNVEISPNTVIIINDDVSVSGFKEFLQFFYRPNVELTMGNISDVLILCENYQVQHGSLICERFLRKSLTDDNLFVIFDYAIRYNLIDLKKECEIILTANTALLQLEYFRNHCSKSVIRHLLGMDYLSCTERQLFLACLDWLKCVSQTVNITRDIIDYHLGESFYNIRFATMTIQEFTGISHPNRDLFHFHEYESIVSAIVTGKCDSSMCFKIEARQLRWNHDAIIECNRMRKSYSETKQYESFVQATEFSTSTSLLLGEFVCR